MSLNLIFGKRNNMKIIPLIIFYDFSLLLLLFLYQTIILLKKRYIKYIFLYMIYEIYMDIFGVQLYMFI